VIPLRDAAPAPRQAVATGALVVACGVVFLAETWVAATGGEAALESFLFRYGLVPADLTAGLAAGDPTAAVALVTHQFLHAGWLHLAGNMLYLWIFGRSVEGRLGRPGFLAAYLVLGALAALMQVAVDPRSTLPLVGASGAISGVLGAYLVLYPRARIMSLVFLVLFYQLMEVPAVALLGLWFGLQLFYGLASLGAASDASSGIAVFAHIGGFLAGMALGLGVRLLGPGRRPPVRLAVG
jgi:rhomboid family protein